MEELPPPNHPYQRWCQQHRKTQLQSRYTPLNQQVVPLQDSFLHLCSLWSGSVQALSEALRPAEGVRTPCRSHNETSSTSQHTCLTGKGWSWSTNVSHVGGHGFHTIRKRPTSEIVYDCTVCWKHQWSLERGKAAVRVAHANATRLTGRKGRDASPEGRKRMKVSGLSESILEHLRENYFEFLGIQSTWAPCPIHLVDKQVSLKN